MRYALGKKFPDEPVAACRDHGSGGAGKPWIERSPNVASDGSTRCDWRDQPCAAGARTGGGTDKKLGELTDALVFPHVHPDQTLDLALERMGANQIEILPVVNRADMHKLEGMVTLRDVLGAYGVSRS